MHVIICSSSSSTKGVPACSRPPPPVQLPECDSTGKGPSGWSTQHKRPRCARPQAVRVSRFPLAHVLNPACTRGYGGQTAWCGWLLNVGCALSPTTNCFHNVPSWAGAWPEALSGHLARGAQLPLLVRHQLRRLRRPGSHHCATVPKQKPQHVLGQLAQFWYGETIKSACLGAQRAVREPLCWLTRVALGEPARPPPWASCTRMCLRSRHRI